MGLGISQFTSLEPARRFLGVLKFANIPNSDITVYAFSLSKTSSDPVSVRRHAEISYYPGQISPDEISVSVYLFQGQLEQLKKAFFGKTYDPKSGAIGAFSIRTTATLELWGPDGSPTGKIVLLNAWITSIDIGNISWKDNDVIDATLGLRFDKLQES